MDIVEMLQNLTDGQKDEYMKLESTLESDGWPIILKWAQELRDASELRVIHAKTWEESRRAFGNMEVYHQMTNLSDLILHQYTALAETNVEAIVETDELDELEYE